MGLARASVTVVLLWLQEVKERWRVVIRLTGHGDGHCANKLWEGAGEEERSPPLRESCPYSIFLLVYPPFLLLLRLSATRHQRQNSTLVVPSSSQTKNMKSRRKHLLAAAAAAKHLVPLIGSCIWIHTNKTPCLNLVQTVQPLKSHLSSRKTDLVGTSV